MNYKLVIQDSISWIFGIAVFAIGIVNMFWGNDPVFGVGIMGLSFIFFPPVNAFARNIYGVKIPVILKVVLGLLILWAALGVGELFAKIDLMMNDL